MTSKPFSIAAPPQTLFGSGTLDRVGDAVPASAKSVVIVADPAMTDLGHVERLRHGLETSGRHVAVCDDIRSDPSEDQVEAAIAEIAAARADTVIAFGGGSALDAGKAAAALAGETGIARFRLSETPMPVRHVGLLAIPTTAGTGSEATRTAVITGADDHVKYWFWSESMRFDGVILDPDLTASLPRHLTAATGADALVHAIEASTNANASPASRLYGHEAIRLVCRHLADAVSDPENAEARGAVLWASFLAGAAIDHAGTALAHCFGHALGSMAPVHHGRAVAIAMAAGAESVAPRNPEAFAEVSRAMGTTADHAVFGNTFRAFMARIGLDLSLPADATGVTAEALVEAAMAPANAAMWQVTAGSLGREELGAVAGRIVARAPSFA